MGLLASTINTGAPVDPRRKCGVCEWVETLDDEDKAALASIMDDVEHRRNGWDNSKAWRACVDAGLTLKLPRFTQHVKRECGRG